LATQPCMPVGCCTLVRSSAVYATTDEGFDDEAVLLAETFAGYAAVAIADAHLYSSTASLVAQMRGRLDGRPTDHRARNGASSSRTVSVEPQSSSNMATRASSWRRCSRGMRWRHPPSRLVSSA
jgi:hypothetical protein